jgi:hypothetical protein
MPSYKLKRQGEFTVKTAGENHCGTTDSLTIRYTLLVQCPATSLDSRGFLFDQTGIQRWFDGQTTVTLSCEAYAAYCAREIYKLVRRENPGLDPSKIELSLSPAPYLAEITFEWDRATGGAIQTLATQTSRYRPEQSGLDLFGVSSPFLQ